MAIRACPEIIYSMIRFKQLLMAASLFSVLIAPIGAFAAENQSEGPTCSNLVVNGDFESPVVTNPDNWDIFSADQTGWKTVWVKMTEDPDQPASASVEFHRSGYFASAHGSQFAELDADWFKPGNSVDWIHPASVAISQTITTIPGQKYAIRFSFSPRPGFDASENKLSFSWNNLLIDSFSADGSSLHATQWTAYMYTLTATSAATTLEFKDIGLPNTFGTFLDNVSVCAIDTSTPPAEQPSNSGSGGGSGSGGSSTSGGGSSGGSGGGNIGEYVSTGNGSGAVSPNQGIGGGLSQNSGNIHNSDIVPSQSNADATSATAVKKDAATDGSQPVQENPIPAKDTSLLANFLSNLFNVKCNIAFLPWILIGIVVAGSIFYGIKKRPSLALSIGIGLLTVLGFLISLICQSELPIILITISGDVLWYLLGTRRAR